MTMAGNQITFDIITDKYLEEIKSKSTATNQTCGEIVVNPSGCILPLTFQNYIERIQNFQVLPDDVWVITFPKCGTTWTQEMVWLLMNGLNYEEAKSTCLELRVPFFELEAILSRLEKNTEMYQGTIELSEKLPSPRCIKSHLPVELLPKQLWTVKPKIVYVIRDPRDVAISFYHHHRLWNGYQGTLEDFVDVFLNDRVVYGPYWSHILGFLDLDNKSHILLNTFENMKKDLGSVIRRTAKFLGVRITDEDAEILKEHLSFKSMRANKSVNKEVLASEVKKDTKADEGDDNLNFIRRGEVENWKGQLGADILGEDDGMSVELMQRSLLTNVALS